MGKLFRCISFFFGIIAVIYIGATYYNDDNIELLIFFAFEGFCLGNIFQIFIRDHLK